MGRGNPGIWEEEALGLRGGSTRVWRKEALKLGGGSSGIGRRKYFGWEEEAPGLGGEVLRLSSGVGRGKLWLITGGGGLLKFKDRPTDIPMYTIVIR